MSLQTATVKSDNSELQNKGRLSAQNIIVNNSYSFSENSKLNVPQDQFKTDKLYAAFVIFPI